MAPCPAGTASCMSLTPKTHQVYGRAEIRAHRRTQGGELPQAVTRHDDRFCTAALQPQSPGRHPGSEHRRLGAFGSVELLARSLLHQLPQGRSPARRRPRRTWCEPRQRGPQGPPTCRPIASPVLGRRMQRPWALRENPAIIDNVRTPLPYGGSRRGRSSNATASPPRAPYRCASTTTPPGADTNGSAPESCS